LALPMKGGSSSIRPSKLPLSATHPGFHPILDVPARSQSPRRIERTPRCGREGHRL
jgi:hypothetical protein